MTVHPGKLEHPQNRRPPLFRLRSTISPSHPSLLHGTQVRISGNVSVLRHSGKPVHAMKRPLLPYLIARGLLHASHTLSISSSRLTLGTSSRAISSCLSSRLKYSPSSPLQSRFPCATRLRPSSILAVNLKSTSIGKCSPRNPATTLPGRVAINAFPESAHRCLDVLYRILPGPISDWRLCTGKEDS